MKIAVACDHGGLQLKNALIKNMEGQGYEDVDFGTYTTDSCDYPDYASKAAKAVASGECDKGVVVCGTGIGVSIVAFSPFFLLKVILAPLSPTLSQIPFAITLSSVISIS